MTRALRKARHGAVLTFVLAGLMCGTFTVRLPALADRLRLPESSVGLALLGWGVGALLTMQIMRVVLGRAGSRGVLRAAVPLCAASLVLVALAPSFPALVAATALFGMAFGAVDVGMNAQGSLVERAYGRPIMIGMHAGWCVGAIAAGLLGTAAIALGLSLTTHILLVALVSAPAALALSRTHLPDRAPETGAARESGRARRRLPGVVYLLGAITFAAFMVEGVVADWNGLYLLGTLHASEAVAALGYPVFEAGMLVARLGGDRLRGRLGARALIALSGGATALAFLAVVAAPVTAAAVAALFFVGLAVATISPMALSLAGTATAEPGPAIAQASAMGYAGLLLGPVVIGFLSAAASLRLAMGVAVVLGVVIAAAGRLLPASRTEIVPLRAAARDGGEEPHLPLAA
ncbi:MFS transporter [Microbispora amethystogenes]|uniref:MFS transporter n=1 Tax=Microbispora amethystogenes TaxID=1427754 RepID=UPI0033DBA56A